MRCEKLYVRLHAAITIASHLQPQTRRLFNLHHPCERCGESKAVVRGPTQLDNELQQMVTDVAFIRGQGGWRRSDQSTAMPSSAPSATTARTAPPSTSSHSGLSSRIFRRRWEALSSRSSRHHWSNTTPPASHHDKHRLWQRRKEEEVPESILSRVPFYRRAREGARFFHEGCHPGRPILIPLTFNGSKNQGRPSAPTIGARFSAMALLPVPSASTTYHAQCMRNMR